MDEDPRVTRTRQVVLRAAFNLLAKEGFAAVTPVRIAALTGVSRSTIYRHWPDPDDILIDAVALGPQDEDLPVVGDLDADSHALLDNIARMLTETAIPSVLAAMVERSEHEPTVEDALRDLLGRRQERFGRQLAVAVASTAAADDPAGLFPFVVGPLFFQRLVARQPITPEFVDRVVEILGLLTESPAKPRRRRRRRRDAGT